MVRYTRHARDQMTLRHISEAEVEEVLQRHHTHYTDRKGNDIYIGHPGSRRVKVVPNVAATFRSPPARWRPKGLRYIGGHRCRLT